MDAECETDEFRWEDEIAVAVLVRQALQEVDTTPLWQYDFPRVAATPTAVEKTEQALGFRLDEQYRQFLLRADGWEHFHQDVDLFGTPELLGGGHTPAAQEYLDSAVETGILASLGLDRDSVLPVGATDQQSDLFLLVRPPADRPGRVLWLAGEVIDEYPTFEEYFLAMVDYMRYDYQMFKTGKFPPRS